MTHAPTSICRPPLATPFERPARCLPEAAGLAFGGFQPFLTRGRTRTGVAQARQHLERSALDKEGIFSAPGVGSR